MKKTLTLLLLIGITLYGIYFLRSAIPFMPVYGISMEPVLHSGDLITIKPVAPAEIKEGDIIVYNVPLSIQEHYNYPPVVAHRVVEVRENESGFGLRTKGDNTGEDPFTVRAQDLRGTVSNQIPYLGFPLLFLQSQQGLIFVIIALCLFGLYLFADELGRGRRRATRGLFAPILEESHHGVRVLSQKIDNTGQMMGDTQRALNNFASAIEVYAEHLKSHTSAIQGLSEASHELKRGAAEQNRVLSRIAEVMQTPAGVRAGMPRVEPVTPAEPVKPAVKKIHFPPGCVRSQQKSADQKETVRAS